MLPDFAVVSLSDSFTELWPKLALSAGAELRMADAPGRLDRLDESWLGKLQATANEISTALGYKPPTQRLAA